LRYRVERTHRGTWAIVDHHISKIRMHNDVVDTFASREGARVKCRLLNFEHKEREDRRLAI
jgi:hypothetical protein